MPYETGTATGPADLLSKLNTFCAANGWTVHFSGARTGGAGAGGSALIMTRGAVQVCFNTNNGAGTAGDPGPWVGGYQWAGTYSAATTETQTNQSATINSNWMAGPYVAYHFFTPPGGAARPYIHVVVEVTSGTFRHFGAGLLRTLGAITTGVYHHGTNQNQSAGFINDAFTSAHAWPFDGQTSTSANSEGTWVRADFGGVVPQFLRASLNTSTTSLRLAGGPRLTNSVIGASALLRHVGPSAFTGRAPFVPCMLWAERDITNRLFSPIGFPDDVRHVNIRNFNGGDTVTLGSDTWRIFPVVRKNGAVGQPNSGEFGMAYRQT